MDATITVPDTQNAHVTVKISGITSHSVDCETTYTLGDDGTVTIPTDPDTCIGGALSSNQCALLGMKYYDTKNLLQIQVQPHGEMVLTFRAFKSS